MSGRHRSVLATPASEPRMVAKALASAADRVFLDLEDAVAASEKAAARRQVIRSMLELDWRGRPRTFRVNGLRTPYFYRDLIEVVEAAGEVVDTILVPKVERADDVYVVATLLTQLEQGLGLTEPIGIEAQIESAAGVLNAAAIAAADRRLEALVFGPGDYAAAVGMPVAAIGVPDRWDACYPGHRFHGVMLQILLAGRAAGIRVVDGPFAAYRDQVGLRASSERARALGYDGKWCIHPDQIETVNEVFSPTTEEVAWARRVVAAARAAEQDGRGASAVGETMIDAASIRMAERTLSLKGTAVHGGDTAGEDERSRERKGERSGSSNGAG